MADVPPTITALVKAPELINVQLERDYDDEAGAYTSDIRYTAWTRSQHVDGPRVAHWDFVLDASAPEPDLAGQDAVLAHQNLLVSLDTPDPLTLLPETVPPYGGDPPLNRP